MTTKKSTATKVTVIINQRPYHFEVEQITGADLKRAADVAPANLLFREVPGPKDDEPIADDQVVTLHSGDHFYDMPPGNFGFA
ncbi:MAG TPA: multiubiquitin domain-containing protein [Thermoleophilaceae bacterium]|nr:multiubiquitin domain-containing protein [Thermoleophilaceae bacterium]